MTASPALAAAPRPLPYVVPLDQLRMTDIESVGGKNASLGVLISQLAQAGVAVPGGFATTAAAFRDFLHDNQLDRKIENALATLNIKDVRAHAMLGGQLRGWIFDAPIPARAR